MQKASPPSGSQGWLRFDKHSQRKTIRFFLSPPCRFPFRSGKFWHNNMLLTEKFGPRVRFASIFMQQKFHRILYWKKPLCTSCMQCVDICPVKALDGRNTGWSDQQEGLCNTIGSIVQTVCLTLWLLHQSLPCWRGQEVVPE